MAGMESHGRHRHRAPEEASTEAAWDRPMWSARPQQPRHHEAGALGWEDTFDGRGALDGLGFGYLSADSGDRPRGRHAAPEPEDEAPPTFSHSTFPPQRYVREAFARESYPRESYSPAFHAREPYEPYPPYEPYAATAAQPYADPAQRPRPRPQYQSPLGPRAPEPHAGRPQQPYQVQPSAPAVAHQPEPRRRSVRKRREARHAARIPVRLALYGVVLTGLIGGTAAWASLDKTVTLTVDGRAQSLHTYASTVGGVLADADLSVGEHDVLAPSAESSIVDGSEIVLRRGRLLTLTVDGKTRQVWTVATSVDEALRLIGYRQSGLYVSASRSNRLPLDGYSLTIRTPKTVVVTADGRSRRFVTTAPTVGEVLDAAGIRVDSDDRVSQLGSAPVVNGMRITVTRVKQQRVVTKTTITYKEVVTEDPTLPEGTRKVTREGVNGVQEVTYLVTYLDGKTASRKVLARRVLRRAVNQEVVVGTKPAAPVGAGGYPTYGGLNWAALAECESGGNPRAVNPAGPYYGLYQFDLGTWQSNGGTGNPIDASVEEQTRVAYNLYQARGRSPWPVCGQYL
jgi:resuscitation-promoting factor RpfB